LSLSGTIPSGEVALQVAGVADLVYGPFVTNDLVVDEAVAAAGWVPNAPNLMAFLPIVGEAELQIVGDEATLTGTAGSAEKKAQLEGALGAALGPDVALTSSIEVTGKTPPLYVAEAPGDGTVTLSGTMPDQAAIDLIADAAVESFGEASVANEMTIGTDIDTTFSIFRIPLTFAQFKPIPEWELRIENDVISGNVRGGATFDFGSAELTPALRALLDTGAGILLRNPTILMTIEGHTDSVGSDRFNLALSDARAQAGVDYLVALGVQPARLFAVGYGETRPIADNDTAAGRTQNRRLEFVLGPPS
jgi:OOP family OmpA-OmpF porin